MEENLTKGTVTSHILWIVDVKISWKYKKLDAVIGGQIQMDVCHATLLYIHSSKIGLSHSITRSSMCCVQYN